MARDRGVVWSLERVESDLLVGVDVLDQGLCEMRRRDQAWAMMRSRLRETAAPFET